MMTLTRHFILHLTIVRGGKRGGAARNAVTNTHATDYNNVKSGSTPAMVVLPRVGPRYTHKHTHQEQQLLSHSVHVSSFPCYTISHRHGFFKSVALRGAGTQQEDATQQANEDEVHTVQCSYYARPLVHDKQLPVSLAPGGGRGRALPPACAAQPTHEHG